MLARAPGHRPDSIDAETVYGAIWSAYAAAADRLIFAHIDTTALPVEPLAGRDPDFARAMDALARKRASEWREGYPGKIWQAAREEIRTVLARYK